MPSGFDRFAAWTPEATARAINSYLGPDAKTLGQDALQVYAHRKVCYGWQILVEFPDGARRLNILVTRLAPFGAPLVALADPPPKLTWPHVEGDGVLCLLAESAALDWTQPVAVLAKLLADAAGLIESCADQHYRDTEFRREFLSYWGRSTDKTLLGISLLRLMPPSRRVRAWFGKDIWIFGEDDESIVHWLTNRYGSSVRPTEISPSGLLWLNAPMTPREFPANGSDLKQLLVTADSNARGMTSALLTEDFRSLPFVLAANTDNGPCVAGIELVRPVENSMNGRRRDCMTYGFRPGRVPSTVVSARALSHSSTVARYTVERADIDWIHNRGRDQRVHMLNGATVVIVGCGSLGGAVAIQLAMSGVGHLVMCDPDILSFANTGRHVLGADYVGINKAEAMAKHLRIRLPHISAAAIRSRWQEADWPSLIEGSSLIVSATGDWASDAALNARMVSTGYCRAIIYGWMEAYASAGQAVAILPGHGCLQCGFHLNGRPKTELTRWAEATLRQEPGCGTTFQPYGPTELSYSIALVSNLALDCLIGSSQSSTHRAWFGSTTRLHGQGGEWDATAIDRFGDPGPGERVARAAWNTDPSCPVCAIR